MRAVVFDLDGVLVDSESINRLAFDDYLTGLNVRPSDELFAITLGRRFVDFVDELAATLERPAADVGAGLQVATEARLSSAALTKMPFASEALATVARRDIRIGLASSSGLDFIHRALAELEMERYFVAIASGEEVELGKPHPAIYNLAAARLEVPASECVAIEDSAPGIAAAHRAGMICIGVPNGLGRAADLDQADAVADNLTIAVQMVTSGGIRLPPAPRNPGSARSTKPPCHESRGGDMPTPSSWVTGPQRRTYYPFGH